MFMRAPRFLLALLLIAVAGPAASFEDAALGRAADAYRLTIEKQRVGKRTQARSAAAWSRARKLAAKKDWAGAIGQYEKAIALGGRDALLWLGLSVAQSAKTPPGRDQALAASYNAYRAAQTKPARARALFRIGGVFDSRGEPDRAIKAYGEGLALVRDRRVQSRHDALMARYRFWLVKTVVEAESDTPRICLQFSQNLPPRGRVNYGDYVRISPEIKAAFTARGKTLCIGGVTHGRAYQVAVLRGLPSAGGISAQKSERFTVTVADRKPSVGFRGRAFILPRRGGQSLPLVSVNVDRVMLKLLRVNDRNLIAEINEGHI
ncbi:MAG: hypothetical protein V3S44_10470, partial [Alphaproteobacteria bacterium]